MHTWLPDLSLHVVRGTNWGSICQLVLGERGVWDTAHLHMQRTEPRDAQRNNTYTCQLVQTVGHSSQDIWLHLPCKKLSSKYIGPFDIRQVNPVTYEFHLPSHYIIHITFHISLLKPYTPLVSISPTVWSCWPIPPISISLPGWWTCVCKKENPELIMTPYWLPKLSGRLRGLQAWGTILGLQWWHFGCNSLDYLQCTSSYTSIKIPRPHEWAVEEGWGIMS